MGIFGTQNYEEEPPALFSDPNVTPPPDSHIFAAPSSGLGMADTQEAAPVETHAPSSVNILRPPSNMDLKQQAFDRMSTGQKIFAALGEFGAGVQGKESPMEKTMLRNRQERALQAQELKTHVTALEDGVKMASKLQGDAKTGFVDDYARQLEEVRPGLGETFKHVSNQPDLMTKFQSYMPYLPESMKLMLKNSPDEFLKFTGTGDGIKVLEKAKEQYDAKIATQQASGTVAHLQQLGLPPEMLDAAHKDAEAHGGKLTASMFHKIQDYLPQGHPYKISAETRQSINSNKDQSDLFYRSLGMHSPADEADMDKKSAETKPKLQPGEMTDIPLGGKGFAKAAYDPKKTLFPQAEHDDNGFAILGKGTKEGTTINMPSSEGFGTNPDTGAVGHYRIGKNGDLAWDKVTPAPKEQDPIKAAVAKLIAAGSKDTPGKVQIIPPQGSAAKLPAADQLAIEHKFKADPSMSGNTLGAKTAQGYEVKKGGKLIGYYQ